MNASDQREVQMRQLEPEARAYMDRLLQSGGKALPQMSLVAAREYMQASQSGLFSNPEVHAAEREIAGVRCRVVRPAKAARDLPRVLYLHGGGWVLGSPETHARLVCTLALRANAELVVPDYARAPEHHYPVALEQCVAIAEELANSGARIAVAGDSAGANLAAAVALLCAQRGSVEFALQALICPVLEADSNTESYRAFAHGFNLDAETMEWFWSQYVEASRRVEMTASPLRAPSELFAQVSPAFIVTAGCDVLRDEGEEYGSRLVMAGNSATVLRCAATIHNFVVIDELAHSGPAIAATAAMSEALRAALHPKQNRPIERSGGWR
jgi:acetyl esterase/lipase